MYFLLQIQVWFALLAGIQFRILCLQKSEHVFQLKHSSFAFLEYHTEKARLCWWSFAIYSKLMYSGITNDKCECLQPYYMSFKDLMHQAIILIIEKLLSKK